ncbi:hypothetical protein KAZ66_00625 [Candidatus Woesebacteria bacterium]|nr:hypothetical protein [Candidatus Woesebacteria bacterium]
MNNTELNTFDKVAIASAIAGTLSVVTASIVPTISIPMLSIGVIGSVIGATTQMYSFMQNKKSLLDELSTRSHLINYLSENGYKEATSTSTNQKIMINKKTSEAIVIPDQATFSGKDVEKIISLV